MKPTQYLTLQLLLLLLRAHRQVNLSVVASVFPQPIQYQSRKRNLLRDLDFKPGQSRFYEGILCNKGDRLGPFNLAVYWKRKYRQKGPKEPWYIHCKGGFTRLQRTTKVKGANYSAIKTLG